MLGSTQECSVFYSDACHNLCHDLRILCELDWTKTSLVVIIIPLVVHSLAQLSLALYYAVSFLCAYDSNRGWDLM